MSYLGDGIASAMARAYLLYGLIVAVFAIALWELIPWLWQHIHWS